MLTQLHKTKYLNPVRRYIGKKLRNKRITFNFFFDYRKDIYDKLLTIHESDRWGGGSMHEAYNLFTLAKNCSKLDGDMAEVGVGNGGMATVICEAKGDKELFLFDSFGGFQEITDEELKHMREECNQDIGTHAVDYFKLCDYFSDNYSDVHLIQGWFPKSAKKYENKRFCFVDLDVNTYKSTKECLEWFYPRMVTHGIIITHDYTISPFVRKAFDEFSELNNVPIIELAGSHAVVVK